MILVIFLAKKCFAYDGYQNMFVFQPILIILEFKNEKGTMFLV